MSNSQEQSLDENVIFLPVDESSAEFLHCEREREAVERLLIAGPEAFYSSIGTERSGCFLSPEEVTQITTWAQSYRFHPPPGPQENGVEGAYDLEDFCSTYFPCQTDMPTPNLELGWPEKEVLVLKGNATVHTSPPAEGEPGVREIIRQHLQRANQVVAIVTDRLTDGAIIRDLHSAASRGVPIYIILNRRSMQENFTLNRLRHPNMRVRVLGGKDFCTRTGRMVVGEMKNKFLLVDLETVIHGSYSLTWSDAHLHRQLITVLSGPVVDSFDREFRILYAASLPLPEKWSNTGNHIQMAHQEENSSDHRLHKQLYLEPESINPPSPPSDSFLDWEAMGVVQRDSSLSEDLLDQCNEVFVQEVQQQYNNAPFYTNMPVRDGFTTREDQFVERKRIYENTSPVTTAVQDKSPTFQHTEPPPPEPATSERIRRMYENTSPVTTAVQDKSPTFQHAEPPPPEPATSERMRRIYKNTSPVTTAVQDKSPTFQHTEPPPPEPATSERMRKIERSIEMAVLRQLSNEKSSDLHDRSPSRFDNKPTEPTHIFPSTKRRERLTEEPMLENESSMNESLNEENSPSSRKPVILRTHSESFSSLSDIMRRLQRSSSGLLKRGSSSERTQSMMDLSRHNTDTNNDERGVPVPRLKGSFDPEPMTAALALMKKRNEDVKSALYRTPKNFLPRERPRSSSYALNMDWRRSLTEVEGEQE